MNIIEQTIREYLPDVLHMSLGTSKDNRPWVCEVHFSYDDELNLYFRSLTTRRHSREIAENSYVSGNVVRQFGIGEMPLGVYFEGMAKLLKSEDTIAKAAEIVNQRYSFGDKIIQEAARPDGAHFYKISVETFYVFGKLEGDKPQKYSLPWAKQ